MKKLIQYNILIAILLTVMSCKNDDEICLVGSGQANEYILDVAAFSEVHLMGPIKLRIKQGPTQEVKVVAEPEIYAPLTYEVTNNVLNIGFEQDINCFETNLGVWVNITVPDISKISTTGDCSIVSDGDLDLEQLEIDAEGSTTVSLSGKVTTQILKSTGTFNVTNFDFESYITLIEITGSANISILCTYSLDIMVNGEAVVNFKGNPLITETINGSLVINDSN